MAKASPDQAPDPAGQQTTLDAATPPDPTGPAVAVRVLATCHYGNVDDVADVPAEEIDNAKHLGLVDDHPDAVAYARSLVSA